MSFDQSRCQLPVNSPEAASRTAAESRVAAIDLHGVAGLIDTVAGADPGRLSTLLRVLATSQERLEARVVVELALRCRDPLAPLATLCRDALQTVADLEEVLVAKNRQAARQACRNARAGALLNLCDATLANDNPHGQARRKRCRAVRPRLKVAAALERNLRGEAIDRLAQQRQYQCPDYWRLLEAFLARLPRLSSERLEFAAS